MDDFEKALIIEMEKRPPEASLIYNAGAEWAREWCKENMYEHYRRTYHENAKLREALERVNQGVSGGKARIGPNQIEEITGMALAEQALETGGDE